MMDREAQDAMNLIDNMASNQEWSGRKNSRGGGNQYKADQIAALSAELDAMQKAFDKMSVKVVVNHRPQPCVMCGDKGHSYEHCLHTERDEKTEQVNYLNNEPSYFSRPLFNNPSSSNNSCNFYNNASFNNSNNHPFQSDPPEPYIAPAVSNFMNEQRKMNQMRFEQMQAINAQLAARSKIINMQMTHRATFNQPLPYQLPVPFLQRLAELETCCAVNVVDQLAKRQVREGYESLVKN